MHIDIKNLGPVALLRDRRLVPARFIASIALDDGTRVHLDVEVGADDSAACRRYSLEAAEGEAITGETQRKVPGIGRLVKLALEAAARTVAVDATGKVQSIQVGGSQTVEAALPGRSKGGRRRRLTDDQFRAVAAAYRRAVDHGNYPKQAVAAEMHVSESTAGRYIMEARRRGFLGKAPGKGKAGEEA